MTPLLVALALVASGIFGALWGGTIPLRRDKGNEVVPPVTASYIVQWAISAFLFVLIGLLISLLIGTTACAIGLEDGKVDLSGCSENLRNWYSVLSPWQGGIGAGIGLLGLAWAHQFGRTSRHHDDE